MSTIPSWDRVVIERVAISELLWDKLSDDLAEGLS